MNEWKYSRRDLLLRIQSSRLPIILESQEPGRQREKHDGLDDEGQARNPESVRVIDSCGEDFRKAAGAEMGGAVGPIDRRQNHRQVVKQTLADAQEASAQDQLRDQHIREQ